MKKTFFSSSPKRYYYISLFFFLVLFDPGVTVAQGDEGGGSKSSLNYGAKIGVTINSFSNGQPHNNNTLGVTVGAFAGYALSGKLALQVEALYAQEGGRLLSFDVPDIIGDQYWYTMKVENRNLVLHNVNIPVLLKYKLDIKNLKFNVLLGPDIGFTLKAISTEEVTVFDDTDAFQTYTDNDDITAETESYNIAATVGIGIEIPFGSNTIIIEGRYRYGLTPVYKSYSYIKGVPQIAGDLNSNSISITIGLGF